MVYWYISNWGNMFNCALKMYSKNNTMQQTLSILNTFKAMPMWKYSITSVMAPLLLELIYSTQDYEFEKLQLFIFS